METTRQQKIAKQIQRDIAEIFMLAAVVSNITDDAILEWKKKHHCTRDPSACILASHSFVTTHCKHVFLANVCLECVAIALIVIGIGSTLYGHLNALDDVEEEEDEPPRRSSRSAGRMQPSRTKNQRGGYKPKNFADMDEDDDLDFEFLDLK